ncbi:MAG TPA: hypothetical protein PL187_22390 [Caldilinea sp.]|nr:hypothetical protein [Caldilinea sp.]
MQSINIGELGGADEQKAAKYIANKMTKPVTGFIAFSRSGYQSDGFGPLATAR